MQAQYELSFNDYKNAQWVYLKHRPFNLLVFVLFYCVLPLCCLLLLVVSLYARKQGHASQATLILLNLRPLLVTLVVIAFLRQFSIWRTYLSLFEKKSPRTAVFSFDDEQFISAIPARSEARVHWSALVDFAEDKKVTLLFLAKNRFLFIPKRALTLEQLESLRALAAPQRQKKS